MKTPHKPDLNTIYNEDCLETMKRMPDGFVDLVLTDPPYAMTANKWDKALDLESLWRELRRIAREGAIFVFTASQPFTTDLINSNRKWFKYEWIWQKSNFSNQMNAKHQPLKIHENIIVFYKGKEDLMVEFGKYVKAQRTKLGLSLKQVGELCNHPWYHRGGHMFFETGMSLPSEAEYLKLKDVLQLDNRFDEIAVARTYNPQGIITVNKTTRQGTKITDNIGGGVRDMAYQQEFTNYPKSIQKFANETGFHPTQKPLALMNYLVRTYSNEGDTIYDPFIGSGTTARACKDLSRNYIGSEISAEYCKITEKRLRQEVLL